MPTSDTDPTAIPIPVAIQLLQIQRQIATDLAVAEAKAASRHVETEAQAVARHKELRPALDAYQRQIDRLEQRNTESLGEAHAAKVAQDAERGRAEAEAKIALLQLQKEKSEGRREVVAVLVKILIPLLIGLFSGGGIAYKFMPAPAGSTTHPDSTSQQAPILNPETKP